MPSPRFENLPPEKRTQILTAAGEAFAEHGYDGATVAHILGHAGISTGAAYYYFDNKADLFTAVVTSYVDRIMDHADFTIEATHAAGFWEEFLEKMRGVMAQAWEPHRVLGALRIAWKLSKELRGDDAIAAQFRRSEGFLRDLVSHGRRVGAIRTDVPAALIERLIASLDEAVDVWLQEQEAFDQAQMLALMGPLVSMLRRMLEPPEGNP